MQVETAHSFQGPHVEGALGEQIARIKGLDMPLRELGVVLLQQLYLLFCEGKPLGLRPLLQLEHPLISLLQVVAHPDVSHRGGAEHHSPHDHLVPHPHLPPGGVLDRELDDLLLDLLRYLVGSCSGYGWPVQERF